MRGALDRKDSLRDMVLQSSTPASWTLWEPQLATVLRMLQMRSYTAVTALMHGVDPLLVCSAKTPAGDAVMVYFLLEKKVGVKTLRKISQECEASACRHAILVTEDGLTAFAQKETEDPERNGGFVVEVFKRKELCFCIMDHSLVPPHVLLTPAQKKELLQKLGCKASALPKLKESDPVARFLRFPVGGVVRIDRVISSCPETYYRVVCA